MNAMQGASPTLKSGNRYAWAVAIALGLMTCGSLGSYSVVIGSFLVPICEDLNIGFSTFSLYFTASYIGIALAYILLNKFVDDVVGKPLHTIIVIVLLVAGFSMAAFTEMWMFIVAAFVIGVCWAFTTGVVLSDTLANWFAKKAGFAIGLAWSVCSVYMMIMAPVMSEVIATVGWRMAMVVMGVISAVVMIPSVAFIIRLKPSDKGMTPYGYEGKNDAVSVEEAESEGVPFKVAIKSPSFILCCVFLALVQITACMNQLFPAYANAVGFSVVVGGLMVSAASLFDIFLNPIVGGFCDKYGISKTIVVWVGVTIVSFTILLFGWMNPIIAIIGAGINDTMYVIAGTGLAMLVLTAFGARDFSRIFAIICAVGYLAASIGMTTMTGLYELTGTFQTVFITCIIADVIIIVVALAAVRLSKKLPRVEGEDDKEAVLPA